MKSDGKLADTKIGEYESQSLLGLMGAVFWKEEGVKVCDKELRLNGDQPLVLIPVQNTPPNRSDLTSRHSSVLEAPSTWKAR